MAHGVEGAWICAYPSVPTCALRPYGRNQGKYLVQYLCSAPAMHLIYLTVTGVSDIGSGVMRPP